MAKFSVGAEKFAREPSGRVTAESTAAYPDASSTITSSSGTDVVFFRDVLKSSKPFTRFSVTFSSRSDSASRSSPGTFCSAATMRSPGRMPPFCGTPGLFPTDRRRCCGCWPGRLVCRFDSHTFFLSGAFLSDDGSSASAVFSTPLFDDDDASSSPPPSPPLASSRRFGEGRLYLVRARVRRR